MTGCVVLDTDRLWCISLCQGVIKQRHICIKNVIIERMTLNDSCHKPASYSCVVHSFEGVMW